MNKIGNLIGLKHECRPLGRNGAAEKLPWPKFLGALEAKRRRKMSSSSTTICFSRSPARWARRTRPSAICLIDAEHKIGELDTIKRSIGKLVDPVSKTLRALEEAKSEKIGLQGALNNIRITNNKLRSELDTAEKKIAVARQRMLAPAGNRDGHPAENGFASKPPEPSRPPNSPRAARRSPTSSAACSSRARSCKSRATRYRRLERARDADRQARGPA